MCIYVAQVYSMEIFLIFEKKKHLFIVLSNSINFCMATQNAPQNANILKWFCVSFDVFQMITDFNMPSEVFLLRISMEPQGGQCTCSCERFFS